MGSGKAVPFNQNALGFGGSAVRQLDIIHLGGPHQPLTSQGCHPCIQLAGKLRKWSGKHCLQSQDVTSSGTTDSRWHGIKDIKPVVHTPGDRLE